MNIYDIAKIAGVSIATVSRVVNDSPHVSEKTKRRVRAVMEENNYTPNVFARGLGLDSMQTIGIVCPDVSDMYMARAVAFLEHRLRGYGYDCILYCSGHQQAKKEAAIELIMKKRIDALVTVGSTYAGYGPGDDSVQYLLEAAEKIPDGEIAVPVKGNPKGEYFARIEQPRGEAIYYVKGNGTKNLDRFRLRTPTTSNIPPMVELLKGCQLADVPLIILTIDPCISCTER